MNKLNSILLGSLITFTSLQIQAGKKDGGLKEQSFKEKYNIETMAAPIINSNPNFGNSLGGTVMTLFDMKPGDENVPPSLLALTGMYSDRDSYFVGVFTKLHPNENWRLRLACPNMSIKSQLDIEGIPERVDYTTDFTAIFTEAQYKFADNFFAGLRVTVKNREFSPDNAAGETFLQNSGAASGTALTLGPVLSYDTRDNQFYPYSGIFVQASLMFNNEDWGAEADYHILETFINGYKQIKENHVIAGRLYGRFTPDNTPFADLSTLGRRADLRGYVAGEETANNLITAQIEYRWHFAKRWAIVGFVGESALYDNDQLNSDSLFTSGGGGIRFTASEERRMNFRIDYAIGQGNSDGLYIGFNEAF